MDIAVDPLALNDNQYWITSGNNCPLNLAILLGASTIGKLFVDWSITL